MLYFSEIIALMFFLFILISIVIGYTLSKFIRSMLNPVLEKNKRWKAVLICISAYSLPLLIFLLNLNHFANGQIDNADMEYLALNINEVITTLKWCTCGFFIVAIILCLFCMFKGIYHIAAYKPAKIDIESDERE